MLQDLVEWTAFSGTRCSNKGFKKGSIKTDDQESTLR